MPLVNLMGELEGTFPRLPYAHSLQLINRAWTRVRDIRLWSWQFVVDAQLYAPALISSGTVTTTQFSTTITVDATAAAAINAAPTIPPIASPTLGIGRQIRVGVGTGITPTNGSIYNIVAWDGVSQITINKPFGEPSLTASQYQIYKCYYSAPAYPFTSTPAADPNLIRFLSLTNRNSGYTIAGRRLHFSQEKLNVFDPARGSLGDAYSIAPYQPNALGQPTFELYPHPTNPTAYAVTYYSRWPDLSLTQDFPQIPYGLVTCTMDLARAHCCSWAMSNAATYPELQQTNWVASATSYRQDFVDGLKLCIKQDDEIMPQLPFKNNTRFWDFPIGGAFLQNHDVSSLLT